MSLVTLKHALDHAKTHQYAIGAFNVHNLNLLHGIINAAQQKSSPVIINVAEVHLQYTSLKEIAPIIRMAARRVDVPVVLHLDHGLNFDTIIGAIKCGFTSVMFDGSSLSYEENLKQTKEIVKIAHAACVSVEAELGAIGGDEGGGLYGEADSQYFTDPRLAKEFVEKTKVDCLAVAIGNAHGLYKGKPKLDFKRLEEIAQQTKIPLVLHGGSGISDDDFRRAVSLGIHKVNVYTAMSQAALKTISEAINSDAASYDHYAQLLQQTETSISDVTKHHMDVFGSSGKVQKG